ncbi:MAG: FAD-dependent oxidoreductase [bacterium]|nr:FAD-dependent oxidoreductase [bacterium]
MFRKFFLLILTLVLCSQSIVFAASSIITTDVLVIGGGCGGVAASIQAARLGVSVILVENTPWLGGMMSSAGVSCFDGNNGTLRTGLFREVCTTIANYYGSVASTNTGCWVTDFAFEPKVGNIAWQQLVSTTSRITTLFNSTCVQVLVSSNTVLGAVIQTHTNDTITIYAHVTIDATEYGDILPLAGVEYKIGREAQSDTGEYAAPTTADDLVQDITYCAIFKNYAPDTVLIPKPPGYDASKYDGSILETTSDITIHLHTVYNFNYMMSYGKLQNRKFMINWPIHGNDWEGNLIEMSPTQRLIALDSAKNETLGFLYYIQNVYGAKTIGLDTTEYPTADHLPFYPYIRECRRMVSAVTYRLPDVTDRYGTPSGDLYKTSVAVGNYSIDHHHKKFHPDTNNPFRIQGENYPKNQTLTIPYGSLLPKQMDGFMAAEKNIGVTHIVNGATRLQPIVILTGQAAGAAAAISCLSAIQPRRVNIRQLQQVLLDARAALFPYSDVEDSRWSFQAINRTSLSGVFMATDSTESWIKYSYFYPTKIQTKFNAGQAVSIALGFDSITSNYINIISTDTLTRAELALFIWEQTGYGNPTSWIPYFTDVSSTHSAFTAVQVFKERGYTRGWADGTTYLPNSGVTREILAVVIDRAIDPFHRLPVQLIPVPRAIHKLPVKWKRHLTNSVEGWTGYPPSWFIPTSDYYRDMALNPMTKHLLITDFLNTTIHIVSARDGSDIGRLDNDGIGTGIRNLMAIDVDTTGVIYACNYDQSAFRIYRWANESARCYLACQTSLSAPAGRVINVYGSGTQTRIYITSGISSGWFHIFTTSNGSTFKLLETAAPTGINVGSNGLYGLAIETSDRVYTKGLTSGLRRYFKSGTNWYNDAAFDNNGFYNSGISDLRYVSERNWLIGFACNPYGPVTTYNGATVNSTGALIYTLGFNGKPMTTAIAPLEETITNLNDSGGLAYDPDTQTVYVLMAQNGYAAYSTTPIEPYPISVELSAFSAE